MLKRNGKVAVRDDQLSLLTSETGMADEIYLTQSDSWPSVIGGSFGRQWFAKMEANAPLRGSGFRGAGENDRGNASSYSRSGNGAEARRNRVDIDRAHTEPARMVISMNVVGKFR